MLQVFKNKIKEEVLNKLKYHNLDNNKEDISKEEIYKLLKFGELNPIILDFITSYNTHFSDYNSLLMQNLKKLHIYIGYSDDKEINGQYNNNKMFLNIPIDEEYNPDNSIFIDTIYHELLHVATTDRKLDINRSGLSKRINGFNLGHKLNEGYTELLTGRYFSKTISDDYYYKERKFAQNIERLLGKDVLRESYFKGDLYTIIKGLEKYIEDPLSFMIETDRGTINPNEVLDKIETKKSKILIKR